MLLEKFTDILLDKDIKTEFIMLTPSVLEAKINSYKLTDIHELAIADKTYFNERIISLEEFRQETSLAMLFKFTNEVLYGELHLSEQDAQKLVDKIALECVKDEYAHIFDDYLPYSELIVANEDTKQFSVMDNASLSENFYQRVFTGLGDVFFSVIASDGYTPGALINELTTSDDPNLVA